MKNIKIILSSILLFSCFTSGVFASTIGVDSKELQSGYDLYKDITDKQYPVNVQYGESIVNALKNCSQCISKAINIGNNNEEFYFSSNGFPSVKADNFTANNNLINLWQAGREDIKETLVNKFKFSIYSKLFQAMKNSYAYNKGYELYLTDNTKLPELNNSYYTSSENLKNSIAGPLLISHSGSYQINAMDFLWQTPEIAPTRYYSDNQKLEYEKFEKSITQIIGKLQKINNTNTLNKLESTLLKVLKDGKKKINNDTFLKYMIIYEMLVNKK